jgi:hypothetical protein
MLIVKKIIIRMIIEGGINVKDMLEGGRGRELLLFGKEVLGV